MTNPTQHTSQTPHTPQAPHMQPAQPRSGSARPIMITTAVVGGLVLFTAGASAAFGVGGPAGSTSGELSSSASVDGITGLDLDLRAGNVTLEYAPVSEAQLEVTGPGSERWGMRRDHNTLVVESPRISSGFCFLGICPEGRRNGMTTVTLTLPKDFQRTALDVDVELAAGDFRADGTFGELSLELGAGEATVSGTARTLDVSVHAGDYNIDLSDVARAGFETAAGSGTAQLTGKAPAEIEIEISAGSLDLTVPDVEYRLDTSVAAGDIETQIRTSQTSPNRIEASVAAGGIVLRPGK